MNYVWNKPVLTFYRERFGKPEKDAFAVVQAQKLKVLAKEDEHKFVCSLQDFFPLMGDIDCLSTPEGKSDKYVVCWFDTKVDDFKEAFRRLTGVSFSEDVNCVLDPRGKRTYNADFVAKHAKLE
ncbi:MAG TPA: hypothetical protein ENO13_00245 [Candidatus Bathyarchaeota archaeon]|nr:hypothetical protein [Candidatus Bathyarchaeota archaeon]